MIKRVKIRLFFLGMIIFALILNSIVDMHPNGLQLKELSLEHSHFSKTKIIINFYDKKIVVNDDFNKVTMLIGVKKEDINLTVNKDYRVIRVLNRQVKLKTEKRTLELLDKNRVSGIGRQFFGITKFNVYRIEVDKKGYFLVSTDKRDKK